MESVKAMVQIVLLHPLEPDFDASVSLVALNRIGGQVDILRATDVDAALLSASRETVDLVVLDRCPGEWVVRMLDSVAEAGPPVVVVVEPDADEADCLETFRSGAADCIRHGVDFAEVLPLVVLEQVRRWRQLRERILTRDKLDWLERLNEAIVSELPVSLAVSDSEGRVVEINPEFSRSFSVSARYALGRPLVELLPTDLVESGGLLDLAEPEGFSRIVKTTDEDSMTRVFDLRVRPLDERGHVLLALSDITRTESLSRRLGEVERYNENIVQSINSALLVVGLDGRVTFANSTAAEILGTEPASLEGRLADDWFGVVEGQTSLIARTLDQGVRFKGRETMIQTESGVRLPIGVSCTPLAGEGSRIQGVVAIFQDLTEIKQLQRQVLQQEKMASIGELAAGIAHEINNPVGFIHANLSQMSEYLDDLAVYLESVDALRNSMTGVVEASALVASSEKLDRVAEEVDVPYLQKDFRAAVRESLEGSERIRHIVSDLRDFSHTGSAERTLADVNQCLDTTANIVWTMMKHSVSLEKDYGKFPELLCYPMELKQVFMNLLVNAYQSIEEKIAGGEGTGLIRIETRRHDDGIEVSISDTGVGVDETHIQRIFDPFFTTKQVGEGMGLGLSTSYGIVKRHGGEMRVESLPGEGATFTLWLPFEAPAEDPDTD
ncbi:MAG: ATP-binding protein [Myxococcota bacterium]|nr:ATP-binding protein [Myxococcota bacterium]